MLEQINVTVGGEEFRIESLPATTALQLLTKTIKIVGGLGKGVTDFPSSAKEFKTLQKDLHKYLHLGTMVEGLLERLGSDEVPQLIKETIRKSRPLWRDKPGAGEGSFDEWFENRFSKSFGDLFTLLFEIYKYNYGEPMEWIAGFFSATPETDLKSPDRGPQKQRAG